MIQTDDFPSVVRRMQRYGGRTALLESSADGAVFALAAGITLRLRLCPRAIGVFLSSRRQGPRPIWKNLKRLPGK